MEVFIIVISAIISQDTVHLEPKGKLHETQARISALTKPSEANLEVGIQSHMSVK